MKYHILTVLVVAEKEKEILVALDKDDVIEKMAEGSELLILVF